MRSVGTLLFPGFELLDAFGPLEMFGVLSDDYRLEMVAERPGAIESRQGPKAIADIGVNDAEPFDIFLIPGGRGMRREVSNAPLIEWIRRHAEASRLVATVCTGAALLARTGLIDGRNATTNKLSFDWVVSQGPDVNWQRHARWCVDGKYYTSSGVSAGMDMALALIADLNGEDQARHAATYAEYVWNAHPDNDPFSLSGDNRQA